MVDLLRTRARLQLCDMRRELIQRLDRCISGGDLALIGSVQLAIEAIDSEQTDDRQNGLMPVSERAYAEIFENLRFPGYERVLVGANGEIDLRGVRLIRLPGD
jgi:hypothetical protein